MEDLLDLYRARAESCEKHHKVFVRELRLKASCHLPDPQFPVHDPAGESPDKALKGKRQAYWEGQFHEAGVYEQDLLEAGNVVKGIAFIESASTTIMVPPGSRYTVDRFLNGLMEVD